MSYVLHGSLCKDVTNVSNFFVVFVCFYEKLQAVTRQAVSPCLQKLVQFGGLNLMTVSRWYTSGSIPHF